MTIEADVEIHGFELKIKRSFVPYKDTYEYTSYWRFLGKNLIRLDVEIPSETIEGFKGFNPSTFVPDELEHVYKHVILDIQEIAFIAIMANTTKGPLSPWSPIITEESLAEVKQLFNL